MTVTSASFRADFPEFANVTTYPDPQVAFWLAYAGKMLDPAVWGDMADFGTELLVAHNLTLSAKDQKAASVGGASGSVSGPMGSKSVGGVSASYDTASVTLEKGGAYNLTSYGVRFLQLSRMFGTGGVQL